MITINGTTHPHRDGLTVQDILREKNFVFRMLAVSVNGQVISRKEYPTTLVPDGADVQVIHMISGG